MKDLKMQKLLMPKATAVWLVDNTSLTFDQIAAFCTLHPLEVKAIADGEVATGIKGVDPIQAHQLSSENIAQCEKNAALPLKLLPPKVLLPQLKRRRGPRYTPLSRRQDRPNAILWLIRNHPELSDAAVSRLGGTTKNTIDAIRNRTHWNSASLQPIDPVALGLCSQVDLDAEVARASKGKPVAAPVETQVLIPASESVSRPVSFEPFEKHPKKEAEHSVDSVFGKISSLKE